MKGFSQFRPLAGDKGHGHGQIIFPEKRKKEKVEAMGSKPYY